MKTMPQNIYEIMVPCTTNSGRPIRTRQHRVWDEKVKEITGGLTIMKPAIGIWKEYRERMIPVRIICTQEQFETIMKMTLKFYEQEAVCGWLISHNAFILEKS